VCKLLLVAMASFLAFQPPASAQAPPASATADLATGIRQVDEGDLEAAVITLDAVVQRLKQEKGHEADLAKAHLYLSMAHLGLSQWERAKGEMREAWRNNRTLALDPREFPPRVVQLYEQVKQEAKDAEPAQAAPKPAAAPQAAQTTPSRKGRGKTVPILIGVGVAAGAGIAVAAASGGGGATSSPAAAPTATPTPTCEVAFESSIPPPGSSIRYPGPGNRIDLTVNFLVLCNYDIEQAALASLLNLGSGTSCIVQMDQLRFHVPGGLSQRVSVPNYVVVAGGCSPPFTTTRLLVELRNQGGNLLISPLPEFGAVYEFVP
jgi:hypothetical protein